MKTKFMLGSLVMTHDVSVFAAKRTGFFEFINASLNRYKSCDWGELCDEDRALSDEAVMNGVDRIFAEYKIPDELLKDCPDDKIWIVTEANRSVTTILFPGEY